MSLKKMPFIASIILIFLCIAIVVYGKITLKHLNYDEYINNSLYDFILEEDYKDMYNLKELIIQNSIDDVDSIFNTSSAILLVTVNGNPKLLGDGIINTCKIDRIILGDNFKVGQDIKIYDFAAWWNMNESLYLGGSTPLKDGNKYLVFLNKAKYPNEKDTYYFSSVPYGHILLNQKINLYIKNETNRITIKEAMNYQFAFSNDTTSEIIEKYRENCDYIIKKIG